MRRALAVQMLAMARANLEEVEHRAEWLGQQVFAYDDDETINRVVTNQIDNIYSASVEFRRRTEEIITEEETPDE